MMTEEFLHYLWKFQLLQGNLITTAGEPVAVIKPGEYNADAGPDFSNARIRIGNTLWVGNVEVHIRSSDWTRHRHADNLRYDTIVLHVVADDDMPVSRLSQEAIPTLCIRDNLNLSLLAVYQELKNARRWIPCEHLLGNVSELVVTGMLDRVMVERVQRKSAMIFTMLESSNNSWEEVTYILIARHFGSKINAQVFEWLARSLPYTLVQRSRDQKFRLEALLFGQAGMLHEHFIDEYPRQLRTEYQFLRQKYGLVPLQDHLWNFLRLRPGGFPTIRIAQLADLLCRQTSLFSQILKADDIHYLAGLFESQCSEYWENHYIFDRASRRRIKKFGEDAIDLILINAAIPLIFTYGQYINRQEVKDNALNMLRQIRGEDNALIRKWASLGMTVADAWNTQALIELRENYCDRRQCLHCQIGSCILS